MKNAKILGIALAVALISLTACAGDSSSMGTEDPILPGEGDGVISDGDGLIEDGDGSTGDGTVSTQNVRLGLSSVSSLGNSAAATATEEGSFANDTTICAVAVDENDIIMSVKFDAVNSSMGFNGTGAFTGDMNTPIRSNKEFGDEYGIRESSGIDQEWYEQVGNFEDWMTGKSVTDVLGMQLTSDNIPDVEELEGGINIDVSDKLEALEKAYADATK